MLLLMTAVHRKLLPSSSFAQQACLRKIFLMLLLMMIVLVKASVRWLLSELKSIINASSEMSFMSAMMFGTFAVLRDWDIRLSASVRVKEPRN